MLSVSLKGFCETTWTERYGSVQQFSCDLEKIIIAALLEISAWRDQKTSAKASCLVAALSQPQFIIAVICLSDVLSVTEPLSKILQSTSMDLKSARQEVVSALSVLSRRREDVDKGFTALWDQAVKLAESPDIDVKLSIPRRCGQQTQRSTYKTENTETFYKLSIYIPLLDCILSSLKDRFPDSLLEAFDLPILVPDCIVKVSEENLMKTVDCLFSRFSGQLALMGLQSSAGSTFLRGEVSVWREKWLNQQHKNLPSTAIEALEKCSPTAYPYLSSLLKFLATLPVSNASAERSFSCLRRLKTWLRTRMGPERLTGLALLNIHRDVDVSVDRVLDAFRASKKRRIAL